jgi:AcrR family transcriptional regulator
VHRSIFFAAQRWREEKTMDDRGVVPMRPRERIISTARDLFRKHGIRGIGVDAIADAADTNKMTLYRHFGSKDDLVVACLRDLAGEADAIWNGFEQDYPGDPIAQIHAWVRCGAECVGDDGRGCDMANVAVELAESDHPARHVIEEFKTEQRNRLAKLCRDAGVAKADLLADTLSLLLEGARVSRQSVGVEGPYARFITSGEAVIAAFAREAVGRKHSRPRRYAAGKAKRPRSPHSTARGGMALKRAR